jgi:zinc transport system substrate-binding protein
MFPRCLRLAPLLLVLLATLLVPACSPAAATGKPVVMCTIFAYYDAARAIAGDQLTVKILLPKSASPHEYEATTADRIAAATSNLYIKNGMGLDDSFDGLVAGSKAKILTIGQLIPENLLHATAETSLDHDAATAPASAPAHAHEHHHADEHGFNPHIWLDPQIQIKAAQIIRDAFIDLDPAGKAAFEANAATYIAQLEKLDADFKAAVPTFKTRDFIGFHSAYDYLAQRYGLRQIASIEEIPGADITIDQTQKIIQLVKANNIRYIAVETAFSAQSAKLIFDQTGAKQIVLQPLETYDDLNDTYVSYMRKNLEALKTALGS